MYFLQEFKQYLLCDRRSATPTVFNHCYYVKKFLDSCGKSPSDVEIKDVQVYTASLIAKGLSNGTVSNFITSMRVFYNWYAYKYKSSDLTEVCYFLNKIMRTRVDRSIPKVPSPEEVGRLRDAMAAYLIAASFNKTSEQYRLVLRDVCLIELLISTGARSSEIRSIRVDDVDFEGSTVLITKGKGNKQRHALFSPVAEQLLKDYIAYCGMNSGDLIFPISHCNGVNALIRRWARKSSINPQLHAHSFRHFHITDAQRRGIPVEYVADQVGHENVNMTRHYTHLDVNHRRDKYKVLWVN